MQRYDLVKIGLSKEILFDIRHFISIYFRRSLMTDKSDIEKEMRACAEWLKYLLSDYIDAEVNKTLSTLGLEKN